MSPLEEHLDQLNEKQSVVFNEMQRFRTHDDRWFADLKDRLNEPAKKLTEHFDETMFGASVEKFTGEIVERLDDVSEWSVDSEEILDEFRHAGHPVEDVGSIGSLALSDVEAVRDGIATSERVTAAATGAVTGAAGLTGALADLPAVIVIAMRAIHEHAVCYGFELEGAAPRYHALLVLAAAASSGDGRREALDEISEFAARLQSKKVDDVDVPTSATTDIAERLVLRLGRGKLLQSLPIVGALIGGGLDQMFLKRVTRIASHAYRERWLLRTLHEREGQRTDGT